MDRQLVSRDFERLPRGYAPFGARTRAPDACARGDRVVGKTAFSSRFHWTCIDAGGRYTTDAAAAGTNVTRCSIYLACGFSFGRSGFFWELAMFAIIGILIVFGCVAAGYLMEQATCGCSSNRRSGDHRWSGNWNRAGRQPIAHHKEDCGRDRWRYRQFEVWQGDLHHYLENDV